MSIRVQNQNNHPLPMAAASLLGPDLVGFCSRKSEPKTQKPNRICLSEAIEEQGLDLIDLRRPLEGDGYFGFEP